MPTIKDLSEDLQKKITAFLKEVRYRGAPLSPEQDVDAPIEHKYDENRSGDPANPDYQPVVDEWQPEITLLEWAIQKREYRLVDALLAAGANITPCLGYINNPTLFAIALKHRGEDALLTQRNASGETLLDVLFQEMVMIDRGNRSAMEDYFRTGKIPQELQRGRYLLGLQTIEQIIKIIDRRENNLPSEKMNAENYNKYFGNPVSISLRLTGGSFSNEVALKMYHDSVNKMIKGYHDMRLSFARNLPAIQARANTLYLTLLQNEAAPLPKDMQDIAFKYALENEFEGHHSESKSFRDENAYWGPIADSKFFTEEVLAKITAAAYRNAQASLGHYKGIALPPTPPDTKKHKAAAESTPAPLPDVRRGALLTVARLEPHYKDYMEKALKKKEASVGEILHAVLQNAIKRGYVNVVKILLPLQPVDPAISNSFMALSKENREMQAYIRKELISRQQSQSAPPRPVTTAYDNKAKERVPSSAADATNLEMEQEKRKKERHHRPGHGSGDED